VPLPPTRVKRFRSTLPTNVDTQRLAEIVRGHGVRDERLLSAIAEIPRAAFVPLETAAAAYRDAPIPIPHDQVTTQPSLIAQMVEALELTGEENVLEVGTGYGWQSALLARLAGMVWSIERWSDLAATARANLEGITNVRVVVGDGSEGLPDEAPFDAVIVAAAFTSVPPPLVDQVAEGGRLVQPIGPGGRDDVILFEKRPDGLVDVRSIVPAHFVRLRGRYGYSPEA
jgi:protein-L-isoaspartate(D-aspartate) O-methyltransferase